MMTLKKKTKDGAVKKLSDYNFKCSILVSGKTDFDECDQYIFWPI